MTSAAGPSAWARDLHAHLTSHVEIERGMLEEYRSAAEASSSKAFGYLVNLLIEDEIRHHRILTELADSLETMSLRPREQGLNCDGGDCGFAPDAPIRVKFDRWLLPTTAVRQSISLYTEGTQLGVFLMPDYDVTARVLGYRADAPLSPGTVYILQFSDADKIRTDFGFRSYDGDSFRAIAAIRFSDGQRSCVIPHRRRTPLRTR